MHESPLHLGIDVGTSGVRACAIDTTAKIAAFAATTLAASVRAGAEATQDPQSWWAAVRTVLRELSERVDLDRVTGLAVDGTSGTALALDSALEPIGQALMYDDARAVDEAHRIAAIAPRESGAHGATSGLAKVLHLLGRHGARVCKVASQADWLAGRFLGRQGATDANNALKFGYDPVARQWPAWLELVGVQGHLLPRVHEPGTILGTVNPLVAGELGISQRARVHAGTTDSVAAFVAAGALQSGEAVTSLGSTLVLKVISKAPVFAPEFGVYSHRLGDLWLAGGASNTGGAVLDRLFGQQALERLTARLEPKRPTGLDYYPLLRPGERFPIRDPRLEPRLEPRPADDAVFLQGVLEGIARIEAHGYRVLAAHGAPFPRRVRSVGGGARSAAFTEIRALALGVELVTAECEEAAYGTALLAQRGVTRGTRSS